MLPSISYINILNFMLKILVEQLIEEQISLWKPDKTFQFFVVVSCIMYNFCIAANTILPCVNDVLICFFVHRPTWEGGQYEGDDATRFETLRLAMELGVDYVDVELKVRLILQSNLLCFLNCLDKGGT
jgi:hypothetical protein